MEPLVRSEPLLDRDRQIVPAFSSFIAFASSSSATLRSIVARCLMRATVVSELLIHRIDEVTRPLRQCVCDLMVSADIS